MSPEISTLPIQVHKELCLPPSVASRSSLITRCSCTRRRRRCSARSAVRRAGKQTDRPTLIFPRKGERERHTHRDTERVSSTQFPAIGGCGHVIWTRQIDDDAGDSGRRYKMQYCDKGQYAWSICYLIVFSQEFVSYQPQFLPGYLHRPCKGFGQSPLKREHETLPTCITRNINNGIK